MRVICFAIVLVFLPFLAFSGDSTSSNKYVRYNIELERSSMKPGAAGTLHLRLAPQKGIHINTEPAMSFVLNDSSDFSLTGKLRFQTIKVDTSIFLDTSKTIRQSFTLAKGAKAGQHVLKGTLTYFYCSDAEGWCSRFKQPVEVMVNVAK
jgi:hypothetical protein